MLILHIITSLKIGGAESSLRNLLKNFKEDTNHKMDHCVIYFHDGPNSLEIKNLGITTYHVQGIISSYDPIAIYRLLKLIYYKIKPDIIHSALWSANIISRVVGWLFKIPVICDLHCNYFHQGKFRNLLERVSLNLPCKLVAVSNSTKDSFEKYLKPAQKISVISNGINIKHIHEYKKDIKEFVIGSVGRLVPVKNYDVLLKAFALLNKSINAKVYLVGDGPERKNLENLAKDLGIENQVKFYGSQNNAYEFYRNFDCFVLPSESEGMSIALLEALSFGLPIVTTHYKNSHDVIVDGINGFLVSHGNDHELSNAILRLYEDKNLCESIRKSNLQLSKSKFDIKIMAQKYEKVYEEFSF